MNRQEALKLMDDYLEGTLPDGVRIAFEAHLLTDPVCQSELDRLRSLLSEASSLPSELPPRRDLWPGIQSRIGEGNGKSEQASGNAITRPVKWSRTWRPVTTIAAICLIGLAAVFIGRFPSRDSEGQSGLVGLIADVYGIGGWNEAEQEFLKTISDLNAAFEMRRESIPGPALKVIEESLRVIDDAIESSRSAVAENPSSMVLQTFLSDTYRQKVELLEWSTQIISLN
jgi:hypothetical protein